MKINSPLITTYHTFQKQTSLSQFEIVTSSGKLKISVPTIKATRKGPYNKVEIDYSNNWQIELWRSMENAYQKSPFFIYYDYKIKPLVMKQHKYLIDFNLALFNELAKVLKLSYEIDDATPIYFSDYGQLEIPEYPQVFDTKISFQNDVCILDLLFNLGPETTDYLRSIKQMTPLH